MKLKPFALLLSALCLAWACKHEVQSPGTTANNNGNNSGNIPDIVSGTCSPDTVYFSNTVLPLINSGCAISGCHDQQSHQEGLVLNSYNGIMKIVRAGNASESKLYQVITANNEDIMPPPPHAPFSSATITVIRQWISQGAKNNQCVSSCDTSLFTYSGAVAPIMNTYCKGCHNAASLSGGVDLSTYNGVRTTALNGSLAGSINHSAGYTAMPQGGNKLQSCQIIQIEKWIQAGVANN